MTASQHLSGEHRLLRLAAAAMPETTRPRRHLTVMNSRALNLLAMAVVSVATLAGQAPQAVDTTTLGPRVGAVVPAFTGVDQFGTPRTLASTYGPKGAMLVFFRSADW